MSAPATVPAAAVSRATANAGAAPGPEPPGREWLIQTLRWAFVGWSAVGVAFMCWIGWAGIDWTGYPGPAWTRQHFFTAGMVFYLWMLQLGIRMARAGQGQVCIWCRPVLIAAQTSHLLDLVREGEQLNAIRAGDQQIIDQLEQLVTGYERHADLQQQRISLLEQQLGLEHADPRDEARDGGRSGDAP